VTNLVADNAVLGIVAIGMTFVIASGGIDLSVGSVMALASIAVATLVGERHWHPAVAIPAVVAGGAAFGIAMGSLIQAFRLAPFLVTLAVLFLARGVAFVVSREPVAIVHPLWREWAEAVIPLGGGARLPLTGAVLVVVAFVAAVVGRYTVFGRNTYAIGGGEEAALLLGVPVARTRVAIYGTSGLCSALAGVVATIYSGAGDPASGAGMELEAIAAAVVGGASLRGGCGGITGTVLGVLMFGTVQTLLAFEGTLSSGWARVAVGGLLLCFVLARNLIGRAAGGGRAAFE
jgi:ribose/xylose/arabinose/galactoside ABC-type transport system permease subunit